jgi:hypothetical protein
MSYAVYRGNQDKKQESDPDWLLYVQERQEQEK